MDLNSYKAIFQDESERIRASIDIKLDLPDNQALEVDDIPSVVEECVQGLIKCHAQGFYTEAERNLNRIKMILQVDIPQTSQMLETLDFFHFLVQIIEEYPQIYGISGFGCLSNVEYYSYVDIRPYISNKKLVSVVFDGIFGEDYDLHNECLTFLLNIMAMRIPAYEEHIHSIEMAQWHESLSFFDYSTANRVFMVLYSIYHYYNLIPPPEMFVTMCTELHTREGFSHSYKGYYMLVMPVLSHKYEYLRMFIMTEGLDTLVERIRAPYSDESYFVLFFLDELVKSLVSDSEKGEYKVRNKLMKHIDSDIIYDCFSKTCSQDVRLYSICVMLHCIKYSPSLKNNQNGYRMALKCLNVLRNGMFKLKSVCLKLLSTVIDVTESDVLHELRGRGLLKDIVEAFFIDDALVIKCAISLTYSCLSKVNMTVYEREIKQELEDLGLLEAISAIDTSIVSETTGYKLESIAKMIIDRSSGTIEEPCE